MMRQSINKNKLYLYLFFLIFLSSIFNFQILENYKDNFSIKKININGLSLHEKKIVEDELNNLKNKNIFKLDKKIILEKLNKFNFLEKIYVKKAMPSSININLENADVNIQESNINLQKTNILGKTLRNGKSFYIGQNGKFINSDQLLEKNITASVFGDFSISDFLILQEILKNLQVENKKIEKYFYYKNKRWDILFFNGLTLKLPPKNIEKSVRIYKQLFDSDNLVNKKIVDLRVNNQIILTNNNE